MWSKNENITDRKVSILASATPVDDVRKGELVFLKTPLETRRTGNPLLDVFVVVVAKELANNTHSFIKKNLPYQGELDLKHIRYVTRYEELPERVQLAISTARNSSAAIDRIELKDSRILIAAPINAIPRQSLVELLSPILPTLPICSVSVPKLAPMTQEQAKSLTLEYWPTLYQQANNLGPHFKRVSEAAIGIREDVEQWLDLAEDVAREASTADSGEHIGVVIVERKNGIARPVAVACDARWYNWPRTSSGNVTAHAAMRAIAMVASGLKAQNEAGKESRNATELEERSIFRDQPLGPLEQKHYVAAASGNGYLCHDLEIYCTHEPCVMCSMAIVHSRFGKIVFKQRMPRTGGICADNELGHGLFWRKELNWQMLAWQWVTGADGQQDAIVTNLHA